MDGKNQYCTCFKNDPVGVNALSTLADVDVRDGMNWEEGAKDSVIRNGLKHIIDGDNQPAGQRGQDSKMQKRHKHLQKSETGLDQTARNAESDEGIKQLLQRNQLLMDTRASLIINED